MKRSLELFQQQTLLGLCLILTLSFIIGCHKDVENNVSDDSLPNDQATAFPLFSTEIHSLSQEELAELGPINDIPANFIYPGAYFAQIVFPKRLLNVEKGNSVIDYIAKSSFQLPIPDLLSKSTLAISSKGFSFETLKDAKTDADIQAGFPTPVEVVYLVLDEKLDKDLMLDDIFKNVDQGKIKNRKIGEYEISLFENPLLMQLDQSGSSVGKIDSICAGVCFPSENSVVFISGSTSAMEAYFEDKPGDSRGIVAQRLARANVETAAIIFQYDYDWNNVNTQLVQLPIPVTQELMQIIQKNVAAFQFVFDLTKDDGNLLNLIINTKSEDGASELRKAIGTALMQSVDNLVKAKEQAGSNVSSIDDLVSLLKNVTLRADKANVFGSLVNNQNTRDFFANAVENLNDARDNASIYAQYDIAEETLFQLSRAFTTYFGKNKVYPAPICDASGNPLLSWRVALLPVFGEQYQKLYDQFKLDEPWNSENNIKLLDQMPSIYASPFDPNLKNKTQYLIFNTPGTPFGNAQQGLKIQDVADPSRTLSVVLAAPQHAIEWTRPELFAFNPQKPTETFGPFVCAATLLGEVVRSSCDDTEKSAKTIASLIYGVVDATEDKDESGAENTDTEGQPSASTEEQTSPVEKSTDN